MQECLGGRVVGFMQSSPGGEVGGHSGTTCNASKVRPRWWSSFWSSSDEPESSVHGTWK